MYYTFSLSKINELYFLSCLGEIREGSQFLNNTFRSSTVISFITSV